MESYVLMLQTDSEDRELTEAILKDINSPIPVNFLANADEIDDYVLDEGMPSIILISDSSRKMAIQLVKKLKSGKNFSHIPVVVLGEKTLESYVKECYAEGANSFIIKPSSLSETRKKIEFFFKYWFEVAELAKPSQQNFQPSTLNVQP